MNEENLHGVMHSRTDIKNSLNKIVDLLWEEDIENRHERTMGDCLEFFLEQNIFEILGAYTKSDKPTGFFKIGWAAITKIITEVNSTSLLSQSCVHQTLAMLLNQIHVSLVHKSQLHIYREDIVDLVTAINEKAYNEPHVVNLFFSNVRKVSNKKSERGEYLPLKILLALLKEIKSDEPNLAFVQQWYFTLKVVMRTNSKPLDEYIMNDSDLIEIVITKLNGLYSSLPERVSK